MPMVRVFMCTLILLAAVTAYDIRKSRDLWKAFQRKQYRVLDGDIRLVDGTNRYNGRLEIFNNGDWGTVCDNNFNKAASEVVCRQIGLTGNDFYDEAYYGEGIGKIWLDNLDCAGDELDISSCRHNEFGDHNCTHREDVGVVCESPLLYTEGQVRLVDGPSSWQGRVEIFHNYSWGTVCNDYWDNNDAKVVCRQLGYNEGIALVHSEGYANSRIWLDNVECDGSELTLAQCAANPWGVNNCRHYEDAGVDCVVVSDSGDDADSVDDGDVRLANGPSNRQGRVEVFYNDAWGTICDDDWDDSDADVVCRQLGFVGGEAVVDLEYGEGIGDIVMDNVACTGAEEEIFDCEFYGLGVHNCGHFEDAGVNCVD